MAVKNNTFPKTKDYAPKLPTPVYKPENYDQLIQNNGARCRIYKTLLCPNVKQIDGGNHEVDCKICYNTGFVDFDPIESFAYLGNMQLEQDFEMQGVWEAESAFATFLSGVDLQYFTKVELLDFTDLFSERIQRQEGEVDRLRYRAREVPVIVNNDGVRYFEGTDFEITPDGDIRWIDRRPAKGTVYSIKYSYDIIYRATKAMHINRFAQDRAKKPRAIPIQLPQQWLLKRDFLIHKKDFEGSILAPNQIINQYSI